MLKHVDIPLPCKVKEKKVAILKGRPEITNLFSFFKLMQYIKMVFFTILEIFKLFAYFIKV